jgi:hypothetical protein
MTTQATHADKIASAARYDRSAKYHCVGDVDHGVLIVSVHQFEHLPRRAKALGGSLSTGRGVLPETGRGFVIVTADDGSECIVSSQAA